MNITSVGSLCTGCGACESICPKNAIAMQYSDDGFLYPKVDEKTCLECSKCINICPTGKSPETANQIVGTYAGYVKDKKIVRNSSSGGMFSLMADFVLDRGGVVIGAVYDRNQKEVVYKSTDDVSLGELRRSKYVSPNPGGIFKFVKSALTTKRLVLFCGLPCHVAGLYNFIGKPCENLITCDFVCGGVPSATFFKEHLLQLEKKYKANVSAVNFRAKLYGWKQHSIKIDFDNGKSFGVHSKCDSYFSGYFNKCFQRDCCYDCAYRTDHFSDVIIADYWGGVRKGVENDTGISMVIINSTRGDKFFCSVIDTENAEISEISSDDAKYAFKVNKDKNKADREKKSIFISLYNKYGFEKAAKATYHKGIFLFEIKQCLKKTMKIFHGGKAT